MKQVSDSPTYFSQLFKIRAHYAENITISAIITDLILLAHTNPPLLLHFVFQMLKGKKKYWLLLAFNFIFYFLYKTATALTVFKWQHKKYDYFVLTLGVNKAAMKYNKSREDHAAILIPPIVIFQLKFSEMYCTMS